jgi:hypothetical protein
MARRLPDEESKQVWEALKRRLTAFDGGPPDTPSESGAVQSDLNAFPTSFPDRCVVAAECLPEEALLSAITRGMARLGDQCLFFLAKEYAEGDERNGLEWEVPLTAITSQTLSTISPGFECYLYSVNDRWAIYFHHEGFAFCGGVPEFIDVLRQECKSVDPGHLEEILG